MVVFLASTSKQRSRPLLGCTLGFGVPFSAQILSRAGYDYLLIDMEHNPLSAREAGMMTHVIMSASAGKCRPLIRIPSHGVEWVKWALDCGSSGLLIPMVESQAQMEQIVQNAVYPPRGKRSFGPAMAVYADTQSDSSVEKYHTQTSPDLALVPMIESVQGLENAEEICSVDAVNAVFIGPVDLRMSMGLRGGDGSEEEYLEALQKVLQICKRLEKPIGIFAADDKGCQKRMSEGFDFLMLPGEAALLSAGAKAQLANVGNAIGIAKI